MSSNDLDFGREVPPKPAQYPEPPERPQGGGCGTCLIAFLIAFVVLLALCCLGGYYVYQNIQAIGTKFARETAVAVIEEMDLPEEDKREVIAQIDRVVDEYEAGRITLEEVGGVFEELANSPLMGLIMVYAAMENYVEPSGLSDEEKTNAKQTFQRIARGITEEKISEEDLEPALDCVSTTTETGERQLSESVTDEQLRAMLAECKRVADEAGIPDEEFVIDVGAEFKRAVDRALGVDAPDEQAAPPDDVPEEDAVEQQPPSRHEPNGLDAT